MTDEITSLQRALAHMDAAVGDFDIAGHGDTRGTDWYMDLICVAFSDANKGRIPAALSQRGLVGVPYGQPVTSQ